MSSAALTAGYLVILAAALLLQMAGRLSDRIPTLGQAVAALNRLRFGRPLAAAAWLWAGWHFFVRGSWS